ncbi:MAG: hypothetical protein ACN2B6_04785 [Rickettsiales bacterium]
MPLYLIFFRNQQGVVGHYVMLCSAKKLRKLLKLKHGFSDPKEYGRIVYKSYEKEPNDTLKYMLKSRYDCDPDLLKGSENRLF